EPLGLIGLADRLGAARRHADVAALYGRWLERCRSPVNHVIEFNRGVALANLGELPAAERAYRAAIQLDPRFPQAWFNLGAALERLDRSAEALEAWESMLARGIVDPGSARELYLLVLNSFGRLLEQTREFQRAEARLRESLELEPDQPKVIQ